MIDRRLVLPAVIVCLLGGAAVYNATRSRSDGSGAGDATSEGSISRSSEKLSTGDQRGHPSPSQESEKSRVEKLLELSRLHDAPIEFHGLVIDQDEKPVSGAAVSWVVGKTGYFSQTRSDRGVAVTNNDGLFSVKGQNGRVFNLEKIEKQGYAQATTKYLGYAYGSTPAPHVADEKRPIRFLVIKDGTATSVRSMDKKFALQWNKGDIRVPLDFHGLVLVINPTRNADVDLQRGFAWNVTIAMEGAEIIEWERGTAMVAPLSGYQKSLQIVTPKGNNGWNLGFNKLFVFRTNAGLFGTININFYADRSESDKCLYVTPSINLSGGRNLN
jgi:hypothetical protein